MTSILLDAYKKDLLDTFVNSFNIDNFYLFVSSAFDNEPINNSQFASDLLVRQTIFGKKILPDDVFYSVKEIPWVADLIYDQYDDSVELGTKRFYAVIDSISSGSGDYEVYKCLFNKNSSKSSVTPIYDADIEDQIYRTSDGYVWKYMYSITEEDYTKYNTNGYIPVFETTANTAPIENSSIDTMLVDNFSANKGYTNAEGAIDTVFVSDIVISGSLNMFSSFYEGQTLYVTNENNISRLYTILTYVFNISSNNAIVTLTDKDAFITPLCTYKILPKIKIFGDGTGAKAYPKIENGSIKEIVVLEPGSGYTIASAVLIDPLYNFDPSLSPLNYETAIVRPILSPKGGHGSNLPNELLSKSVIIYAGILEVDNAFIPSINSFSKFCIIKNPEFKANNNSDLFDNRLRLNLDSAAAASIGDKITQTTDGNISFTGLVHETASAGATLFLVEYTGPYVSNPTNGDFSLDITLPIQTESAQSFGINSIISSPYVQNTGEVIYISSFNPIERTVLSKEQFKIAIEF